MFLCPAPLNQLVFDKQTMNESTDNITASEIGIYKTCPKAWSYYKARVPQRNQTELMAGVDYHQAVGEHTRMLKKTKRLIVGLIFLTVTALILLIYLEVSQ